AATASGTAAGFPILNALVLVPAAGAVVVALLPRGRVDMTRPVGALFAAVTGALALYLAFAFDTADAGFQFESVQSWIPALGISWHLGVDGISLWLVVLTGLIFPVVLVGVDPHGDPKPYTAWMLALQAGSIGAFLALDLFLFFVMFEIVLVPMYMLIAGWGYANRRYAATKFFLYTMAGSALLLVGIVAVATLSAASTGDGITFDLVELAQAQGLATNTARLCFVAFALAFVVKVPVVPLHTWLPDAHTEAPTAGSVVLAAVLLKLGAYGLLRFGLYLFPEASVWFAPALVTVGVAGIVWGAVAAAMQSDLKRLVAYSSVAHMGFIVLGLFAFTRQSLSGGIVLMVSHGVSTGALFLLVGMLYERRHTREIAELSGIQSAAPVFAGVFTLVMLSSIGVPGLNGFVGEFMILIGSFGTRRWWTVVAAAGVILAALYLLWAYQRVFHGEPTEADRQTADLRWRERLVLVPFVVAIVGLGVYPKPLLDRIEPAVEALVSHVAEHSDFEPTEPVPAGPAPASAGP
ncbi:MAG TPA: Fe-S-binding domain-containing protein, partial [Acidimicrobiaceae bacterium]|nr:Fe-S-binding domain-containing protein [Acidimicrobiaceae bacterium]